MQQITTQHIRAFLLTEEIENERKYAPIGFCLITPEGTIDFANEAWLTITSQSPEEIESDTWKETTFHANDLAKMTGLFDNRVTRRDGFTTESRLKDRPNGPAWALTTAYAELHPTGAFKNVVCWLTDLTAQKGSEQLRQRMEEALEMKRQQENFIDVSGRLTSFCMVGA